MYIQRHTPYQLLVDIGFYGLVRRVFPQERMFVIFQASLRFVSGSPASRPDTIPSFCFGLSGIDLGFDPFILFWVLLHFVSGSPASHPDSIPSFCFRFSGIVSLRFVSGSQASRPI